MSRIIISDKARYDLRQIWHYTVKTWSRIQAKKYYNELLDSCESLSDNGGPAVRSYDYVSPGLFGLHCNHHIVFYRVIKGEKIRVLRILHEKMDFQRHIK